MSLLEFISNNQLITAFIVMCICAVLSSIFGKASLDDDDDEHR